MSASRFQAWALAIDDRNPLWFDTEFARRHGHPAVVMPPLYLPHLLRGPVSVGDLGLDGRRRDALPIRLPRCSRLMAGGEEYRFHADLHDGDEVEVVRTLVSLTPKTGRSGPFVLVEQHTTVARGPRQVAEYRHTTVALP